MSPSMPRKFFEQHVRPNYEEWLRDPLDERRVVAVLVEERARGTWFSTSCVAMDPTVSSAGTGRHPGLRMAACPRTMEG